MSRMQDLRTGIKVLSGGMPNLRPTALLLLTILPVLINAQSTSTSDQDKINPLDVENQNSNEHLSTDGTFWTLGLNLFFFGVFLLVFEANRFYPQIFLKRCVKKFTSTSRVPPRPPEWAFGWFWSLWQITEEEVLAMVGLDAFMLLRFHVICLKLCCFLSFWGLLVLTPLYSTAAITSTWDTYTLSNVLKGENRMKFRLWAAAVFAYIFSAYFCKLLQTEYNAFCIRRLIYLTQQYNHESALEGGTLSGDPDTPQQTYYTVMVERLPKELRSPQKLRNYLNEIFPGEVYAVEVMFDLTELNTICAQRHDIQNKLEHAIATYEVTKTRPVIYLPSDRPYLSPAYPPELESRYLPQITGWIMCLDRLFAPEEYGFEPQDAMHYYTTKLIELNKKVKDLQEPHEESPGSAGSSARDGSGKPARSKDMLELAKEKGTVAGALASKINDASTAGLKNTMQFLETNVKGFTMASFLFGDTKKDFTKELIGRERKAMRQTRKSRNERANSRAEQERERPLSFSGENNEGGGMDTPRVSFGAASGVDARGSEMQQPQSQGSPDHNSSDSDEEGECDQEDEIATIDPTNLTPASFMRKLSISTKAIRSASSVAEIAFFSPGSDRNGSQPPASDTCENFISDVISEDKASASSLTTADEHFDAEYDASTNEAAQADQHVGISVTTKPFSSFDANEFGSDEMSNNDGISEGAGVESEAGPSDRASHTGTQRSSPGLILPIVNTAKATKTKSSRRARAEEKDNFNAMFDLANYRGGVEMAKSSWRFVSTQARDAAEGLKLGIIEGEKLVEMMAFGSFYKLSSTAFVTFKSRITTSIARQMLISHDDMQISAAPNPKDVIWANVDKPRSLLVMRHTICNVAVVVGSIFWSSLVTEVNSFSTLLRLPHAQQELLSVVILLCFLLILPFIFDYVARNYECMKLESEIQNSIMTRYFWYQLINVYVTVGLGSKNFAEQLLGFLKNPHNLVDVLGKSIPAVSLYFCNLMIVKIFAAVPIEMLRPWQLSTIHLMYASMDTRKATRRDLRSGAFFAWPMLYGWVYPQLLMVLMIVTTYSTIAPLLPPFGVLFFMFAYIMYKYQLLYVYINDYQSGGFMWYAVFSRCIVALLFASITLLGYLSMQLDEMYLNGPFWFLVPLPIAIMYFWHYCDGKYKRQSMELAFGYAKTIDHSSELAGEAGRAMPQDFFEPTLYRQPSLTEKAVYPEPHRSELISRRLTSSSLGSPLAKVVGLGERLRTGSNDSTVYTAYNPLDSESVPDSPASRDPATRDRRSSISLNVHELVDDEDETKEQLEAYFHERVIPLSVVPEGHIPGYRMPVLSVNYGPNSSDRHNARKAAAGGGKGSGKKKIIRKSVRADKSAIPVEPNSESTATRSPSDSAQASIDVEVGFNAGGIPEERNDFDDDFDEDL